MPTALASWIIGRNPLHRGIIIVIKIIIVGLLAIIGLGRNPLHRGIIIVITFNFLDEWEAAYSVGRNPLHRGIIIVMLQRQ